MYGIFLTQIGGRIDMEDLTRKQKQVLNFIKDYWLRNNSSPTIREIMARFKFKALGTVQDYLKTLERKGYIKKERDKARAISLIGFKKTLRDIVEVPVLGKVAAGQPILAVENIEGYVAIDKIWARGENIFALKVQGDSMVNAGIYDDDFVIVKQQPTAENGQIVVALIDDEATVKRFFKSGNSVTLKSENPRIKPFVYQESDAKNISIVGKVIGVFRKYC
jgi:repressor LexA